MIPRSPSQRLLTLTLLCLAAACALYLTTNRAKAQPTTKPAKTTHNPPLKVRVEATNPLEAGKYLVLVGACNDCHTPGWIEKGIEVPESEWLVGVPIGWRGPWGTTYASNLRRNVKAFTEDDWVEEMHTRNDAPPMPWASMHAMPEEDLRAMYKYIKSLKPLGKQTPAMVEPDEEPTTPYYDMRLTPPKALAATNPTTKPAK